MTYTYVMINDSEKPDAIEGVTEELMCSGCGAPIEIKVTLTGAFAQAKLEYEERWVK